MLGTELTEAFGSRHEVVALGRSDLDITDAASCRHRTAECRPDVIINAAALTDVDGCESNPDEAFRVNAEAAGHLAGAAAEVGAAAVYFSTDYVFDGTGTRPYTEGDRPDPRTVYGRSKLGGEESVRARCMRHLIIRTSWVFGIHGKNFIRTILRAAAERSSLRVVCDQRGSPTGARDLAAHALQMVEAGCAGLYHVTNSGDCTWHDLASCAIRWAGLTGVEVVPVSTSEYPRPAPRPAYSVLANERLSRDGLPPMRPWQESARAYVTEWIEKGRP